MDTVLVLALIAGLGHDDFKTRELSDRGLQDLLPLAAPYLFKSQFHPDAEIAVRSKKLYQQWAWHTAGTLKPADWPFLPWIDSLPHTYPNRASLIQDHLGMADGTNDAPSWPKYRNATKFLIYQMLCDGKDLPEVQGLLDAMVVREKGWIKSQHAYKFPDEVLRACD